MTSSAYDNPVFFEQYAQMSRSQQGLEGAGEWHQFKLLVKAQKKENAPCSP